MIMGILTAILLAQFLGIVAWAWNKRRHEDFTEAAHLPLAEDITRESHA